nr:hypothetical protein [Tanacetum cinerariifolium]
MSNTKNTMQTQTSNALHNAIMEAGGKDRPPMLAPGNYVQWKSQIKRYIDTKPNHELIHYCLDNPPYKFKWTEKTIPVAEGSLKTRTEGYMENYKNVSEDIHNQLNAEAKTVHIILTEIDNDIYSTLKDHNKLLLEIEIDKVMALISLSFKKIYKPTNNNLKTSSNTSRANLYNTLRTNRGTGYDNQRVVNIAGARENVVQTMNMLNNKCRTSFVKPEYLKKAKQANPRLYDIGCYNDNLALMLAPKSDEVIRLEKESRSKLSDLIKPFDYTSGVNSRTKQPIVVPVSTREHKQTVNQYVATSLKKIVASESTNQKPRNTIRKQYEHVSKTCRWDGEYLDKMKEKGDVCIFLGYSNMSRAYRVYNKRTRLIVETIHINFDEFSQMTLDHNPNVIAPGKYKVHTRPNQTRTTQLLQDIRKTNKRMSFSTRVIPTTSVSRPKLKSTRLKDRVLCNNSQGNRQEVKDHRKNFKFSNNKTSVTACNGSLNVKTLNVYFVCVTCGKCVLNENHELCVLHYISGVNSRTKQPIVVPISTREHKQTVNQYVATSLKKTVASESTNQKPRNTIRKQYEHVSKTCRWWYSKITPPGFKWKLKSSTLNVTSNLIEIILFIVDSGCSKHTIGNLKLLSNFVEKFLGTVNYGNDQITPILGYGDMSTCYIRDSKGNDLLTGSRGTDLYSITLKNTTSPNLICLMAKALLLQAWLWPRRLSHLNFDTINLLSKDDIMTGLPKLKFIKDHLCSSCELGKAKRIEHQTSMARTPGQNDVVERQNRTLVEAARAMLMQTSGSGISILLTMETTFTGSGNLYCHFFIISSIAVQTPGSGISILLAVGISFTGSGTILVFFIISSIAVQTPGSGISILLAVGTSFTGSENLYCQWELSPGSGNALCILFPTIGLSSIAMKASASSKSKKSLSSKGVRF